jgi:hypothetical protein
MWATSPAVASPLGMSSGGEWGDPYRWPFIFHSPAGFAGVFVSDVTDNLDLGRNNIDLLT